MTLRLLYNLSFDPDIRCEGQLQYAGGLSWFVFSCNQAFRALCSQNVPVRAERGSDADCSGHEPINHFHVVSAS